MRTGLSSWITFGLLAVGLATGQMAHAQVAPVEAPAVPLCVEAPAVPLCPVEPKPASRFWVETDYLLWWIKSSPMPAPLLTRGSTADPLPGTLGQPGTTTLFGGGDVGYGSFSGMRLSAGAGIDTDGLFAVEGSYLLLERRSNAFSASSNASGSPVLGRPLVGPFGSGEFLEATSLPGQFAGQTNISTTTRFQGWEMNLSAKAYRCEGSSFTLLTGFRSLDLNEGVGIRDTLTPLAPDTLNFLGATISPPSTPTDFDSFHTSNKFYGAQIGGRYSYQMGRLSLETTGKVALGVTQQLSTIDGATTLLTPGVPPAVAPGGILAQPTNMGSHFHQTFSVVPEANLTVGYRLTPWLQARIGYSAVYWTNVVRPGNTIDRTVNVNQIPSDPAFGTLPGGPNRPQFTAQQSDFWAQDLNLGLVFSF